MYLIITQSLKISARLCYMYGQTTAQSSDSISNGCYMYLGSVLLPGLCSSRARWPLAPNVCPWATRKSQIFYTNHMLGTIEFYSFRALGSLQFSLEHSLDYLDQLWVKTRTKNLNFVPAKMTHQDKEWHQQLGLCSLLSRYLPEGCQSNYNNSKNRCR